MFARLLGQLGTALDDAGVPYMVIGGQAVLVRGEPRLTRDIDLTVGVGPDAVPVILAVLGSLGLEPLPEDPLVFARQTLVVPAAHPETGVRVDVILSWTPFELDAIRRATPVTVDGATYRVASAEDLVTLKMIAGRPRDLEDVRGVLRRHPDFDRDRVVGWLRDFQVAVESETDLVAAFRDITRSLPMG